jgi:hypothetical protein
VDLVALVHDPLCEVWRWVDERRAPQHRLARARQPPNRTITAQGQEEQRNAQDEEREHKWDAARRVHAAVADRKQRQQREQREASERRDHARERQRDDRPREVDAVPVKHAHLDDRADRGPCGERVARGVARELRGGDLGPPVDAKHEPLQRPHRDETDRLAYQRDDNDRDVRVQDRAERGRDVDG